MRRSSTGYRAIALTTASMPPCACSRTRGPVAAQLSDAGKAKQIGGGLLRERHLQHVDGAPLEAGYVLLRHDLALANDGHGVAEALHFRQHVGREEDGATVVHGFLEQPRYFLLHERVEAARGFVEDQQLGAVHQRLHKAEFLLVALR